MTDYIAVLLAQQEEQEQGEAPELETGPLTVWLGGDKPRPQGPQQRGAEWSRTRPARVPDRVR